MGDRIEEVENYKDFPIFEENPPKRYWLIPEDLYKKLDNEFHFDFDPCPYPNDDNIDGTEIPWGQSNWVNPPFTKKDRINKHGATAFARKAISESKMGKTSVIILPVPKSIYLLLEANAEVRPIGQIPYLEVSTKEPSIPHMWSVLFILREDKKEVKE